MSLYGNSFCVIVLVFAYRCIEADSDAPKALSENLKPLPKKAVEVLTYLTNFILLRSANNLY